MHFPTGRLFRYAVPLALLTCSSIVDAQSAAQFPEAPGKDVVTKVCASCHGAEVTIAKGRTRQQWGEVIVSMIGRGAKGTDQELAQVLDYLAKNLPPEGTAAVAGPPSPQRRPSAGPMDVHVVDTTAADRGKTIYIAECITCHGPKARGKDDSPDLVRSVVVLHDRYGTAIGPFLKKGHVMQSGRPSANLTAANVSDLAHFLHQRVGDTLRSGPYSKVLNVLTGDPKAGAAYFNGAGKCSGCHSATGDLARIGERYDPPTLQQRFLFPRSGGFVRGAPAAKPVMVTVTLPAGTVVTGVLDKIDNFNVSLRDASGDYRSFERTPTTKVEKKDPYSAHYELLEVITDKNIHDVVTYLAGLK